MIQKCTSWRGHRFEARYSVSPVKVDEKTLFWLSIYERGLVVRNSVVKTYHGDVCVRCGAISMLQEGEGR